MKRMTLTSLMLPLALVVGCAQPVNETLELPEEQMTAAETTTADDSPRFTYETADELPPPTLPPAPKAPAQAVAPAAAPPPPSETPAQRTYVVQDGDTLWQISRRYYGRASHENVRRILQANPELEPTRMRIGQEIVIPE